jgi:biopolymer transport protein ExbB
MTNPRKLSGALLIVLLAAGPIFAQDATPSPAAASDQPASQSLLQIILHGGPLVILIWLAILATSITMVTFIIQNILTLRRESLAPAALVDALENDITAGNYQAAWETCDANNNYLANVLKAGLERIGRGKEAVEDGVAEHALREATVMRTRNSYLSVIGVVSPMIGLLGTVVGMMGAFGNLAAAGISDPRGLAASIGEVLTATAAGLSIAIPAFIAYYIFRNRAQMAIVHADDQINRLIADLPFEELQGIRIGEQFSAGGGAPTLGADESRRVSAELTTNCPVCNAPVSPDQSTCPSCGATLDWAK